jgi:hypothetical protein
MAQQYGPRVAVILAFVSAAVFALGTVLQQRVAETSPGAAGRRRPSLSAHSAPRLGSRGRHLRSRLRDPGRRPGDVRAQGKKKKKLNSSGKVTVSPTVTYTPTGGAPSSQTTTVKLRKKRRG